MRKYLDWPDGSRDELSPLSYEEFVKFDYWVGCSDTAFADFLRHNNFVEIDDFDPEELAKASLIIREGEPVIDIERGPYGGENENQVLEVQG